MSMVGVIIGALGCAVVGWYAYSKFKGGSGKHVSHTVVNDPEAQARYDASKNRGEKRLTMKERLELSWAFLYEITEIIINKFSAVDHSAVKDLGRKLSKAGMKYLHVVDLGIRSEAAKSKTAELQEERGKEQVRGK